MKHLAEHEAVFFLFVYDFFGDESLEVFLGVSAEDRQTGVADDLGRCAVVVIVGHNFGSDVSKQFSWMHGKAFQ